MQIQEMEHGDIVSRIEENDQTTNVGWMDDDAFLSPRVKYLYRTQIYHKRTSRVINVVHLNHILVQTWYM